MYCPNWTLDRALNKLSTFTFCNVCLILLSLLNSALNIGVICGFVVNNLKQFLKTIIIRKLQATHFLLAVHSEYTSIEEGFLCHSLKMLQKCHFLFFVTFSKG
jgi:hypothetical protein